MSQGSDPCRHIPEKSGTDAASCLPLPPAATAGAAVWAKAGLARAAANVANNRKSRCTFIRNLLLMIDTHRLAVRDRIPVARQMLGGTPCQRLRGQRGIMGAACAHHGRAEDAEVRYFVRKAPAVDHVGVAVVAHARAPIGVRRGAHCAVRPFLDRDRSRLHEPLLHLALDEGADLLLVVL